MRIKYNRVSTLGQTGNRFINDTEKYDLTLLDKVSGNISFKVRPQSSKLIQLIEDGKVTEVTVEEFSRLGRNTGDVINTLDWLDKKGINVIIRNVGCNQDLMVLKIRFGKWCHLLCRLYTKWSWRISAKERKLGVWYIFNKGED